MPLIALLDKGAIVAELKCDLSEADSYRYYGNPISLI